MRPTPDTPATIARSGREGAPTPADLATSYRTVRRATRRLCEPLSAEDCQVQSMPDASPAKWHLAHTTWFFETFVLEPATSGYRPFHPQFRVLFNSYYQTVGEQHPRPRRGLLTRPPSRRGARLSASTSTNASSTCSSRRAGSPTRRPRSSSSVCTTSSSIRS